MSLLIIKPIETFKKNCKKKLNNLTRLQKRCSVSIQKGLPIVITGKINYAYIFTSMNVILVDSNNLTTTGVVCSYIKN